MRLACLPLYLYLLFGRDNRFAAAVLLGLLGATDWVDGYVARHFHQVSDLGKILDPIADRLLFLVGVGGIIWVDGAPLWFCWAVIAREVFVSIAVITLAALGAKRIDVTWFGKAGTFGLMVAFPLLPGRARATCRSPAFHTAGLGGRDPRPGPLLLRRRPVRAHRVAGPARRTGRSPGSPERPVAPSG